MKIDRVVFAWDGNPLFEGMFEAQCEVWPKLGIQPTLAFVSPLIEEEGWNHRILSEGEVGAGDRGSIVVLPPAPDLPHSPTLNWQAPMALLWLPQFFRGETVMTSGLDQVPLSRRFIDAVADVPDGSFVVGFGGCRQYDGHEAQYGCRYYPSSHMVANADTWSELIPLQPSFAHFLRWAHLQKWPYMWEHVAPGWGLDEATISQLLARSNVPVRLFSEEFFDRWDADRVGRCAQIADLDKVAKGEYSEIHFNRPLLPDEVAVIEHFAKSVACDG